jgi:hypothetical protein
MLKGWECNFKPHPARCDLVYDNKPLGSLPMLGNLFFVDLKFLTPDMLSIHTKYPVEISAFAHIPLSWDLWHAHMGHPSGDAVKRLPIFATGVKVDVSTALQRCKSCIMAKHPHKPYPSSHTPHAKNMLDLIHSDLCGPFPIATPHGKHHFIVFLDDHTNLLNLQLLATKDQALEAWSIVRKKWENHAEHTVKVFRSDNGGEFISAAFTESLTAAGIERQLSAPYAHQQNWKAEHAIHTIEGHLFAMLEMAQLPATLWGEAALMACYLWNRSESTALPAGTTPFELVNHRKPDLVHLHIFGSCCFARIPAELQTKLGPHSHQAIFLGYPEGVKGYRLHDKQTGSFFTARDVIFDENFSSIITHNSDSDDDGDVSLPPAVPSTPVLVLHPAPPASIPAPALRRSDRPCIATRAGQAYADEIVASKARLQTLRDARAARTEHTPLPSLDSTVIDSSADTAAPDITKIKPNVDIPEVFANVIIEEQAHISI